MSDEPKAFFLGGLWLASNSFGQNGRIMREIRQAVKHKGHKVKHI